jgi:UDP-GlcNAc:undecaprenyl-phosphate/decaprenyl-phosphate GlcNAc-1-phosphate transferase
MTSLLVSFAAAFALSAGLVPLCKLLAFRLGYLSAPRIDRWHRKPTALLGGIAIAASTLVVQAVVAGANVPWPLLAAGGLIFLVGLTDDLMPLKPSTKLIAEIALASLVVFVGYRLHWVTSLTLDALLTIVWIVGITNALNLLDNMDGLCAGVAVIAGTSLLAAQLPSAGGSAEAIYLSALLGAACGFLLYNFHPASIFMGDSGSLFLGMSLAVLTLRSQANDGLTGQFFSAVAGPVFVLMLPIFDTALVTVSRLLSGRSASQGGRDHSSHRLVAIGLSERTAVSVLWVLAATGGLIGVIARRMGDSWVGTPAATFAIALAIFAVYLARVRVYENADETLVASGRITPFVADFMYKRRVAEVVMDSCLIAIAYYTSYRLRFEGGGFSQAFPNFLESLPIVLSVQLIVLFLIGAYRGVWRYFSLMDGVVLAKGVLLGTLTIVSVIVYLSRFETYSRSVFVIYAALLFLLLTGSRASFRLIDEFVRRRHGGRRLVIYGAGDRGALALRELLGRETADHRMIGFVDDDPVKWRARVQGYPVLGGVDSLISLIRTGAVDAVIVSSPLVDVQRLREIEALCVEHEVTLSRLNLSLEPLGAVS